MTDYSSAFPRALDLLTNGEITEAVLQCLDYCAHTKNNSDILDALCNLKEFHSYAEYEQLKITLLLCSHYKFEDDNAVEGLKSYSLLAGFRWKPPIMILAGGTDKSIENEMHAYQQLLLEAFSKFEGTIISGGTKAGIAALAGDLGQHYPNKITCIGFLPSKEFTKERTDLNQARYQELVFSETSQKFDLRPVLQYWIELALNNIKKLDIKLLGINGGKISAFEYRLALLLGVNIGIISDSGREADNLAMDKYWGNKENLEFIPYQNQQRIANFLTK